jgi:hypothetical protein
MKLLSIPALAAALSGCAALQTGIGSNPQAVAGAAIAVEARAGTHCAARAGAGKETLSQRRVRLEYERIGFDMAVSPMLSEGAKQGVDKARDVTNGLCPPMPVRPVPPAEAPAPGE